MSFLLSYRRTCFFLTAPGLLLLYAGFLEPGAVHAAGPWKAGVARADITPSGPIWLAGYAARTKPSEGVRQPLYAKALALEDGSGAVSVMVTADLLGFTKDMGEAIAAKVKAQYGLDRDRLVLNASHTHSGPATGQLGRPSYTLAPDQAEVVRRYTARLIDQVVELIGESIKRMQPAELAFEQGFAGFAVNRRRVGHREYPGPTDHDVPVLAVRHADGKPAAILFGYACHATVLSDYQINADWPGYAQAALEKIHPDAVAMFVNGCGADQNPLPRRKVELAEKYGEILAEAVRLTVEGKTKPLDGPLKTVFDTVDVRFQTPPGREEWEKRSRQGSERERTYARQMIELLDQEGKFPESYPYPVQIWQFGDQLTFIALAGEVVVDYSLRFKGSYGWEDTWVSGYNNDVFAYIPSLRILKEGGYEGATSMIGYGHPAPFSWAVEETIAEKVDELVRRVAGGNK